MSIPPVYEALCRASGAELEQVLRSGTPPDPDSLAGWEFRGYNVNPMAELYRIRKFKKGFYWDPARPGELRGYNVKCVQNGLLNPWVEQLQHGEPYRYGLYSVYRVRLHERDNRYPNALMLNYGDGDNPPLEPAQLLRDYLVQVTPEDPDLLLGKGYFALGPLRIPGGFFVAARENRAL